ncbi:MAG: recombinase RecT [Burkholderiales bacterium]|nr:recombinase RecT [Burkholderiales bacterium]
MNATQELTPVAAAARSELDRLLDAPYSPRYMLEGQNIDKMMLIAEQLANSRLSVPEHLRGNIGDCLAIVTQAMLWNMNPFAVAQKTHLVSGRLGYEAQLVIAVVQNSGAIRGSFRFEHRGDGTTVECRAGAVLRGESEITWGEWLSSASVTTKNSPLWKTNVRQQMSYLQAKNWARIYAPGAILGVYSTDELDDTPIEAFSRSAATSAAPAARDALPAYQAADFEKNFPAWNKAVSSGKKTPGDLLAMLSTKAIFSEEQKARILSLKKAPAPEPAKPDATDEFVSQMNAAEDAPF